MNLICFLLIFPFAFACSHSSQKQPTELNSTATSQKSVKHFYVISYVDKPMQGNKPSRKAIWAKSKSQCIGLRNQKLLQISKAEPDQQVTVAGMFFDEKHLLRKLQARPEFTSDYSDEYLELEQHEQIAGVSGCKVVSGTPHEVYREFMTDL